MQQHASVGDGHGATAAIAAHADGAIVFDPHHIAQASAQPDLFEPDRYGGAARRVGERGGRSPVWFVDAPFGSAVLRHYHRGGLAARVLGDRYLYTGRERTRPFREFRLLQQLSVRGLPVPRPLAAGFRRDGLFYGADLLTERIAGARTLAEMLQTGLPETELWRAIGATIARFHRAGAFHADLNAHNVLVDGDGKVWLIDFDRGRLRHPGAWIDANLARLQRSLRKLGIERFGNRWQAAWDALAASRRAGPEATA